MKKSSLRRFVITGLFGYQTVSLDFESRYKILIGENGLGKTTILNALYYILTKRFEKLDEIKFNTIELVFSNKKKLSFSHHDLALYLERPKRYQAGQFYQILSRELSLDDIQKLKSILNDEKLSQSEKNILVSQKVGQLGVKIKAPSQYIYDNIKKVISEYEAIKFQENIKIIEEEISDSILYFPTYRRIESQLKNFNENKNEILSQYPFLEEDDLLQIYNRDLIQFGMDDVKDRINSLTSEITQKSLVGFSNITGDLLGQLSKDFPNVEPSKFTDYNKLQIILDRVGARISVEDKNNIIASIEANNISNKGLLYLINKLIELYNDQEDLDRAIKEFANTCNHYLFNKLFVYDESAVSLKVYRAGAQEELDLDLLSSGEKQIISIFSKIYLEKNSNYIILFDEPELSLSIFWQQRLLPDIIKSNRCSFLLAVTHSPFIYDNELASYATGLDAYIKLEQ